MDALWTTTLRLDEPQSTAYINCLVIVDDWWNHLTIFNKWPVTQLINSFCPFQSLLSSVCWIYIPNLCTICNYLHLPIFSVWSISIDSSRYFKSKSLRKCIPSWIYLEELEEFCYGHSKALKLVENKQIQLRSIQSCLRFPNICHIYFTKNCFILGLSKHLGIFMVIQFRCIGCRW